MEKNTRPSRKTMRRIFAIMIALLFLLFACDVSKMFYLQVIKGDFYKAEAKKNQYLDTEVMAQRGTIYDKNGKPLAQSASAWQVYVNPTKLANIAAAATDKDEKNSKRRSKEKTAKNKVVYEFLNDKIVNELAPLLGMEKEEMRKFLAEETSRRAVKRRIEKPEKDKIQDFIMRNAYCTYQKTSMSGEIKTVSIDSRIGEVIEIIPDVKRYYPNQNLASSVIGAVGDADKGLGGLEAYYNEELAGVPGRIIAAKNGRQDKMDVDYESIVDPIPGRNLVLTLDSNIQYYLETSLEQARADNDADRAFGIVMDVETGAVLAMCTKQDFNPNTPYDIFDKRVKAKIDAIQDKGERQTEIENSRYSQWKNCAITQLYEPGSVFKLVTAAAAIEEKIIPENFTYTCTGYIMVNGEKIKCHNHSGHGTQTFTQGLMNSCNPFFVTIGQMLGDETFYKYEEALGVTERTGIDLPGEASPKPGVTYIPLKKLNTLSLSSSAFGQSNTLTAIQMATIVNTIANDGKMMKPYIVSSVKEQDGNIVSETRPTVKRQAISKRTADELTNMMELVVSQGTGRNAYVPGYRLAGKTGTSQKQRKGSEGQYLASFGCFAPADNPRISMIIVIDNPKSGRYNGGQIATPVAAEVAEKTLTYMGVDPQYTASELAKLGTSVPNVVGKTTSDARRALNGYNVKIIGGGSKVVSQSPAGGQKIPENGVVVIYTDKKADKSITQVPNFVGMGASAANKKALESGLNPRISGTLKGSDLVCYRQSIEKGKSVNTGSVITLYFKTNSGTEELVSQNN